VQRSALITESAEVLPIHSAKQSLIGSGCSEVGRG
jgi:hypothetical protein